LSARGCRVGADAESQRMAYMAQALRRSKAGAVYGHRFIAGAKQTDAPFIRYFDRRAISDRGRECAAFHLAVVACPIYSAVMFGGRRVYSGTVGLSCIKGAGKSYVNIER